MPVYVDKGTAESPRGYHALFRNQATEEACAFAREAAAIGDRFGEPDLAGLARMLHGQALTAAGDHEAGLALMDEAMLAATQGRLSPLVTGLVYCAVIGCCQRVYAIDRAREWTMALDAWCRAQPQLAAFTGTCRAHRSEILQLQGAWEDAIAEARRAAEGLADAEDPGGVAAAFYQQGEILRLRGEHEAAEAAYRNAGRRGREPQPGLALLRLMQGQSEAAAAAIRQAVASAPDPLLRTRYLPAAIEILLAAGDLAGAEEIARELERVAAGARNEILDALASHARGALRHASGDARGALEPLRRAFATWQRFGAPYLAARIRIQIAAALAAVGDAEGAELERDAARAIFQELGAAPDLARLAASDIRGEAQPFGLTPRELEVIRLLASGCTNRAIAGQLFLSEKTVDRHVSNLFAKIDVSSRAAATAFAYQHKLV